MLFRVRHFSIVSNFRICYESMQLITMKFNAGLINQFLADLWQGWWPFGASQSGLLCSGVLKWYNGNSKYLLQFRLEYVCMALSEMVIEFMARLYFANHL